MIKLGNFARHTTAHEESNTSKHMRPQKLDSLYGVRETSYQSTLQLNTVESPFIMAKKASLMSRELRSSLHDSSQSKKHQSGVTT